MKKISLILIVLQTLFLFNSLEAQHKIHIGLVGGLNLAQLDLDLEDQEDEDDLVLNNRVLFGIGGVLDYRFTDKISLIFSPIYVRKGSNFVNTDARQPFNWEFGYLDFHIFFKVTFGNKTIQPYALFGPNLGLLLSARASSSDIKDDFKDIAFGLNFGGGVTLPIGRKNLFFEGYYNHGFRNISDHFLITSLKHKAIQIMVGITFPVGG